MKIVKSLQDSGLLTKCLTQTVENKTKAQRSELLGMLLGTISVSLLRNMLEDKEEIMADHRVIKAGQCF